MPVVQFRLAVRIDTVYKGSVYSTGTRNQTTRQNTRTLDLPIEGQLRKTVTKQKRQHYITGTGDLGVETGRQQLII